MYYPSLAALAAASPLVKRLSYGNPFGLESRDVNPSQLKSPQGGLNATQLKFDYSNTEGSLKVLGRAPQTLEEDDNSSFINQLYRSGEIESRSFSLWLAGYYEGGRIMHGGIYHAKYNGPLFLVPRQLDSNGNPTANTFVRAYNQCGDRALLYEGVTELGFYSGNCGGYTPTVLNNALRIAWNSSLAKYHPEALAAGFGDNE